MIDNAPLGPIETRWGLGFRGYDECMDYIRANGIEAPEGGLAGCRFAMHSTSDRAILSSRPM